jgi:hypothetical protein
VSSVEKRLKVNADIKKNRLYFTIAGSVGKADLDRLYTEVRFCVADLKPGFDVITDLTSCGLGHLSSLPTFRKITHYLASKGVRDVVCIMNPGTVILHQIINFASRAASYKSFWVSSRQEAEDFLEQSARRASLRFCLPGTEVVMQAGGKEEICPLFDISVTGCSVGTVSPLQSILRSFSSFVFLEMEKLPAPLQSARKLFGSWTKDRGLCSLA